MPSDPNSAADLLNALAEEFSDRYRAGERPALTEYVQRHPELAGRIRELFPALVLVEQAGSAVEPFRGTASALLSMPAPGVEHRLGDFRVLREVGRGGMGVVYEAIQESLGRHVALKVLAPGTAANGTYLERFGREARAAARLHHTNIVPVFGVGEAGGTHFYAMQFIHGQGLDAVLADVRRLRSADAPDAFSGNADSGARSLLTGQLPTRSPSDGADGPSANAAPSRDATSSHSSLAGSAVAPYFRSVAQLGLQAAEALAYAHGQGILHRDIKPSNLLLDSQGTLWMTDFGLAKATDSGDLTNTGDLLGTLRYMAPERFDGRADARSDVYGLGATLYEMLTLQPAFQDSDKLRLIAQVKTETPPAPRQLDRRVPQDLETIVLKAMAHDPDGRYQSASAVAEDLRCFLSDRPIRARRASSTERLRRWVRRNPVVATLTAAIIGLVLLIVLGQFASVLLLRRQRDEAVAARQEADAARWSMKQKLWQSLRDQGRAGVLSRRLGQRFDSLRAIGESAKVGRELGLPARDFAELRNLAISALALPDVRRLPGWDMGMADPRDHCCDSKLERYVRADTNGTILVNRTSDNAEIARLQALPGENFLSMSPDGQIVVAYTFAGACRVWQVGVDPPRRLAELQRYKFGRVTPRGHLLWSRTDGSVRMRDLNPGGSEREIVRLPVGANALAVDPGGRRFAMSTGSGVQVRDLETGSLICQFARDVQIPDAGSLAWHPSAEILAFAAVNRRVHIWDVAANRELSALEGFTNDGIHPTFVAGGDLMVTFDWDGKLQFWDWRCGKRVLNIQAAFAVPGSAPERLLVLGHDNPSSAAIWEVEPAREYRTLTVAPAPIPDLGLRDAAIHPQGRLLVMGATVGSSAKIVFWDLDLGRELVTLPEQSSVTTLDETGAIVTNHRGLALRRPLVFDSGPPPRLSFAAAERLSLPTNHEGPVFFSKDGRTLVQRSENGALVRDLNGRVRRLSHSDGRNVAVSPDGRWVATGSHNDTGARVWRADTGELIKELLPDIRLVGVLFSPKGTWLQTNGGSVRLWRTDSWEQVFKFDRMGAVGFSPDETFLAVDDMHGSIHLLEPATGRELARLDDPNQDVHNGILFSPDGTRLIAPSRFGRSVHVWDLRLLRARLAELGLDWDAPPYPPAAASSAPVPIAVDAEALNLPLPKPEAALSPHQALAAWTLAIALLPYNPEAYYRRGVARSDLKDWAGSRADFDAAILLNPGQAPYHWGRAATLRALGNADGWLADLNQVLALEPYDPTVNNLVARFLVAGPERFRDPARALRLARMAVRISNRSHLNRTTLGIALYRNGHAAEAKEVLEKNLVGNELSATAPDLYLLAMCQHALGDAAAAKDFFNRARQVHAKVTADPDDTKELNAFRTEASRVLGLVGPPKK